MTTSSVIADARVLVVDDEPDLRTLYELTLLREGYRVETAADVAQANDLLNAQRFDVLITDMRLPDGLGISLLNRLKAQQRPERCVVMTAYGSAQNAVESLKAGAFDYLTKPVDLKQFRSVVASALQSAAASLAPPPTANAEAVVVNPSIGTPSEKKPKGEAIDKIVGNSAPMRLLKERIGKVARSMAPVMIGGESGTGKELVAQALHAHSHRANGPWVAVNCSAIPEALLEAEFFGARKGAYTGSTHDRPGFFQMAHGGTLFLDEIGDLPLPMQAKLLRAIQERVVRPIGSSNEESVDVRIVSATHKDLPQAVGAGQFRQDLYYRLNVIDLHIPPLRERREDLPALCAALIERICAESGVPPVPLSPQALQRIDTLPLSGNVRELENVLHRALALCDGDMLNLDDGIPCAPPPLPEGARVPRSTATDSVAVPSDLQEHLDQQERDILTQALRDTNFNRTAAAQRLGLTLRQIRYRIARLKIETPGDTDEATDA